MEAAKNDSPTPSAKTGLILITIGVALAFVIPIAVTFAFASIIGQFGMFSPLPSDLLFGIVIVFIAIGGALSLAALKFGNDVVKNKKDKKKANYVIILGIAVFLVGSNIAGILIAIGGYLIRK